MDPKCYWKVVTIVWNLLSLEDSNKYDFFLFSEIIIHFIQEVLHFLIVFYGRQELSNNLVNLVSHLFSFFLR